MMNTPADIVADSAVYLRIYFAGIIFVLIYNMGSAILRATGDSKRPLYYLIVCCIINIVLDVLFVIVFHMGVMGVAVATLIAQAVSAVLVTLKLMRSEGILKLSVKQIRFHGSILKMQLKLGLPTGFEAILFSITNIAIQSAVNTFGTDTTAAWSAYGNWTQFLDGQHCVRNCDHNIRRAKLRRRKMDRVRKSTRVCLLMDFIVSAVLVVFLIAARFLLFRLFTNDSHVIEIGCDMLVLITPWYIVYVFIEVIAGALRGVGNVVVPVAITLLGVCVLRIAWLAAMLKISPTISAIILSYPVTWVITALAFIIYYIYITHKTIAGSSKKHVPKL